MAAALIGLGDSVYLTVQHLAGRNVRCTVAHGCSTVLASQFARIGSMPTAALGAVAYFVAFSLATLAAFGERRAKAGLTFVVMPMFLMTLWLLYVQAFVLHAFCDYCLLSAAMTFVLTGLALLAQRIPSRFVT